MKNTNLFGGLLIILLLVVMGVDLFSLDAVKILSDVDNLRIFSTDGFSFDMSLSDKTDTSQMRIYINKYDESICVYKNKDAGKYILLKDKSFWFYDQGMNAPIRISERQLLVGQASSGDITRIVFSRLYDIAASTEEGDRYILNLQAKKDAGATYDKLKLYVNKTNHKPIKAECLSKTDMLLKSIYYNEYKIINGLEMLSGFEIINELTKESSAVTLDNFTNEKLPANYFNKNYMRFLRLK